jgi:hypothetical protein
MQFQVRPAASCALLFFGVLTCAAPASARITRLEITRVEPAFGGRSFGSVGTFERVIGRAYGEVDPRAAPNAGIQDLELAPSNARGMVEYSTDIEILRPADRARGNGVLLFDVLNRGNKRVLSMFNADLGENPTAMNALTDPGDGWMQQQGYTVVWFGWQADILPGAGRMTFTVPTARNSDGSPVTELVRSEFAVRAPVTTLNLSSGWFTGTTHASYPTVSIDNRTPVPDGFLPALTVRARGNAPREPIPNTEWSFGTCPAGQPTTPDPRQICLPAGFQPGRLYELIYRAQDPWIMGLGFAVARDLGAFLKTSERDDAGTANPVAHGPDVRAIVAGTSQSGRMIRTLVHLGFNQDEAGRRVSDGALPHIGGGLLPLSLRFAQPGRAWGQQVDHLYPAYDFPFTYARQTDPLTGRSQGLLDRCGASGTCPRIFHAATALEMWEGRQSLGLTDPLGLHDVPDPPEVRTFIMASTQHVSAPIPLPARAPFGGNACVQQPNPNPHIWTMRALMDGLTAWVREDREPPASAVPRVSDGTLVAPDAVAFPAIPANSYAGVERPALRYTGAANSLHVLDFGPGYRAGDTAGVMTIEPPRRGSASYGILVPQVDTDGNDLGGVRSLHQLVPIGTYTGWNQFQSAWYDGNFCNFNGSFVPFARTRAERASTGDPRPSLDERYPDRQAYVAAIRLAAAELVARRHLLAGDAERLVAQAEREGVRSGP